MEVRNVEFPFSFTFPSPFLLYLPFLVHRSDDILCCGFHKRKPSLAELRPESVADAQRSVTWLSGRERCSPLGFARMCDPGMSHVSEGDLCYIRRTEKVDCDQVSEPATLVDVDVIHLRHVVEFA